MGSHFLAVNDRRAVLQNIWPPQNSCSFGQPALRSRAMGLYHTGPPFSFLVALGRN